MIEMNKRIAIVLKEFIDSKHISRYALAKLSDTQYPIIDSYYKNKVIRYDSDVLLRICLALNCEVGDIVKIVDIPEIEKNNEGEKNGIT